VLNGWHLGMELKGRYFGFEVCESLFNSCVLLQRVSRVFSVIHARVVNSTFIVAFTNKKSKTNPLIFKLC